MTKWYEALFANYAKSYDQEPFTQGTVGEVDFVERELASDRTRRILDIGCGTGRHAIELARRGYQVTGEFASADFAHNWWGDAGGPNDPSIDDGVQNLNSAGVNVGNYVNYQPYSPSAPLPVGPVVLGLQPRRSNQPVT